MNFLKKNRFYIIFLLINFYLPINFMHINSMEGHRRSNTQSLHDMPPLFLLQNEEGKKIYLLGTLHTGKYMEALGNTIADILGSESFDKIMIEHELKNIGYYLKDQVTNEDNGLNQIEAISDAIYSLDGRYELFISPIESIAFNFQDLLRKPLWLVNMILSGDLNLRMMHKFDCGMERYIIQYLNNNNLEYLEDEKEILSAYENDKTDAEDHKRNIASTLKTIKEYLTLRKFKMAYDAEIRNHPYNVQSLFLNVEKHKHPESVNHRNNMWMEKVENIMKEHRCILIAVGYGHISGQNGLLKKMHDLGFKHIEIFNKESGAPLRIDERTLEEIFKG